MQDPTLGSIFQAGLKNYLRRHALPVFLLKAAQAVRVCRTSALGGHVRSCPLGHVEKVWYNSCGHRSCPQCAFLKIEQWLERKRKMLLPVDHFHLTFTIPSELYIIWRYNYKLMADALFQSARDTLLLLLADPRWMGGVPGVMMNLHTWSRALALNPHVHCLVTAGGLAPDGSWVEPSRRKSLLSLDVVRPIFKAKFVDRVEKLIKQGKLRLPPDMNENDAMWDLQRAIRRKPWIVDRRPRYEHGRGVALYLARYVRGGPIKNGRILSFDGETVMIRKSRRGEPVENVRFGIEEFIRRILDHVPPIGFRIVRTYGLYAPGCGKRREHCREMLGGDIIDVSGRELGEAIPGGVDVVEDFFCTVCGLELEKRQIARRSLYEAAQVEDPHRRGMSSRAPPSVEEARWA